jgi:hypothetical protein
MDVHSPDASVASAEGMPSTVSARAADPLPFSRPRPMADLLGHVGWELYRVGLAEVGRAADRAPCAVLGQELLVESD